MVVVSLRSPPLVEYGIPWGELLGRYDDSGDIGQIIHLTRNPAKPDQTLACSTRGWVIQVSVLYVFYVHEGGRWEIQLNRSGNIRAACDFANHTIRFPNGKTWTKLTEGQSLEMTVRAMSNSSAARPTTILR